MTDGRFTRFVDDADLSTREPRGRKTTYDSYAAVRA